MSPFDSESNSAEAGFARPGPDGSERSTDHAVRDRRTISERLEELDRERTRLLRQRRVNLVLFAVAVSLPVHIAIMIWLYFSRVEAPPGPPNTAPVVLDLSVLPDETLTDMLESLEAEDLLAPELEVDSAEQSLALDATESLDLPDLELDVASSGLDAGLGDPDGALGSGLDSGTGSGAQFFGIRGRGRRFAYVVDVSGSMRGGRWNTARAELVRSLQQLPDYAEFQVLLYSDGVEAPPFQKDWLRATPGQVSRMLGWLENLGANGSTNPMPAFELLFVESRRLPDTIFFLSDGVIEDRIEEQVVLLNSSSRGRPAVVNTIAFSEDASQGTLRGIAARTGGVFRFVPVSRGGRLSRP